MARNEFWVTKNQLNPVPDLEGDEMATGKTRTYITVMRKCSTFAVKVRTAEPRDVEQKSGILV